MKLVFSATGKPCIIKNFTLESDEISRLWELGVTENSVIEAIKVFAGGTVLVRCGGALIALGKRVAEGIIVEYV